MTLIEAFYDTVELDMSDLMGKLSAMSDPAEIQRMFEADEDGAGLLKSSADPEKLAHIQAFTSLIEGYTDRLVKLAGARTASGNRQDRRSLQPQENRAEQGRTVPSGVRWAET